MSKGFAMPRLGDSSGGGFLIVPQFAGKCGVLEKTVRRDLNVLREMGQKIDDLFLDIDGRIEHNFTYGTGVEPIFRHD
jgi:predicted DNA-binding transcriptional regulator YafY